MFFQGWLNWAARLCNRGPRTELQRKDLLKDILLLEPAAMTVNSLYGYRNTNCWRQWVGQREGRGKRSC